LSGRRVEDSLSFYDFPEVGLASRGSFEPDGGFRESFLAQRVHEPLDRVITALVVPTLNLLENRPVTVADGHQAASNESRYGVSAAEPRSFRS